MNVKTRLVVSITVVLALTLAALAAVISSVAAGQAREDGLRYAASLAESKAERVEAGVLRQLQTAQDPRGPGLLPPAAGRGRAVAIEPYNYEVAGSTVLMTSLTVPVRVGDQIVGAAGVDVPLSIVSEQIAAIRPYEVGHALLVSQAGAVVASNRSADVAGEAPEGPAAEVAEEAVSTGEVAQRTVDGSDGPVVLVAAPVRVGEGQNWTVVVEIPESAILAGAKSLRTAILVSALVTMAWRVLPPCSWPGAWWPRSTSCASGWRRSPTATAT